MKKIFSLSILILLLASCGSKPQSDEKEKQKTDVEVTKADVAKNVRVMTLKKSTIDIQQEYMATINAYDVVYLASTIPGRIKEVKVEVGDRVKKGETVVTMDNTSLVKMKLKYHNSLRDKLRGDTLIQSGSVAQQTYDLLLMQYEVDKLDYENMLANVELKSPFNGVVTARYFDDNEIYSSAPNTQQGKASIVTIEEIEKLKVEMSVSARFFPKVKKGLTAQLVTDVFPDITFDGRVSLISPTIDPKTRTFTVEVVIPNQDLILRPGMYAKIMLKLDEKEALVVPAATVLMQEGTANRFIFIEENGVAKKVNITLGERFNEELEIFSELDLIGKHIIYAGQSKLENGDVVNVN